MANRKKPVIQEVTSETSNNLIKAEGDKFDIRHDLDTQQVFLSLIDGTEVILKSPKAKQFLLLDSFSQNAPQEYRTDSFVSMKLVSLCIIKYGNKDSIDFDTLIDTLEMEDLERLVAGLTFFRDKFPGAK